MELKLIKCVVRVCGIRNNGYRKLHKYKVVNEWRKCSENVLTHREESQNGGSIQARLDLKEN